MSQLFERLRYRSYILRLWQERPASPRHPAVWRFSVEDIHTRQRRAFVNLEGLFTFLQTQMEKADAG